MIAYSPRHFSQKTRSSFITAALW